MSGSYREAAPSPFASGDRRNVGEGCASTSAGDCARQERVPKAELKGKIEIEAEVLGQHCGASIKTRRRWWAKRSEKGKKEYLPALPWLARTENLPSAHMSWVFRRHYTTDGRLVITEEKVERHEYFRAHRSDERLTLQLVPLAGDGVLGDRQEMEEDGDGGGGVEMDGGDGVEDVGMAVMGGHKCFEYREGVRSGGSCMARVALHAVTPVLII
ncbi:hypothetical protein RJ640_015036 [Escallonia rubra]|uniref:FAF domain-containing protein n=1 Tax=Escallonia rubra TaxID=112253 RepID=A0AA88RDX5_9ASTE|nr:hypothetical protein RJ640_015036 [Escallonia rubra]